MELPGIAQLTLLMVAALQTIYYYGKLPDKLASHFTVTGAADGWAPASSLFFTYWAVIALALVISLGVPAFIGKLPRQYINLPNKDYWLSDEKYPETLSFLRTHFRWFGAMLLLLLVIVFQMVFQANLSEKPDLGPGIIVVLAVFLVGVVAWGIKFTSRFSKVD